MRKTIKLRAGSHIKVYGLEVQVCVTPDDKLSCNECQIHHLCNRDYRPLKELAKQYDCDGCMDLIGKNNHFKVLK